VWWTGALMDKRIVGLLMALAAFLVVLYVPLPAQVQAGDGVAELTAAGRSAIAVLALAVVLWVTEALPFPVTGMVAIAVLVMTGAGEFRALVREGFGHDIVLFIIGVMILSSAISRTGLLKRVTTSLLFRFGHSPRTLLLAFLVVGALASMWISNLAMAAILTPICAGLLRHRSLEKGQSNFGRALMISCAWGPHIGGIASPAGCGPNPLTIGYLRDLAGIQVSFGEWMLVGLPAAVLMVPFAWVILQKCFPFERLDLTVTEEDARKARAELGRFSRREVSTVAIFCLAISLWLGKPLLDAWTGGATGFLSISFVAMLCGCLFFLPRVEVITWRQAEEDCDWGGLVLIVTGLSLGMAVYNTGAAEWLATLAFSRIGVVPPVGQIFLVVLAVSLMKVLFSSNTVTGVIVVPLLIALSRQVQVDTALLVIPAGITSSLSFILVTSAPANVIPYSAGYFSVRDMAKAGLWMTVCSSVCVTLAFVLMGRFVGINVF
jgi:sodium-dependent dicarboxylate transporter 2/3/5